MSNDAFYYGVLPVLAEAASHYGITAVEMARASIVGQPVHLLSPLVPSTYLLVALAGIDFGDHQRFTLKWAVLVCICILMLHCCWGLSRCSALYKPKTHHFGSWLRGLKSGPFLV